MSAQPSVCIGVYDRGVNQGGQPWTFATVPGNGGNRPAPRSALAPAHTVSSSCPMYLLARRGRDSLEKQIGRRKLTVAECLILQGAEGHILIGAKTEQYRQVGNGVPPIMAQRLAEAVKIADQKPHHHQQTRTAHR